MKGMQKKQEKMSELRSAKAFGSHLRGYRLSPITIFIYQKFSFTVVPFQMIL